MYYGHVPQRSVPSAQTSQDHTGKDITSGTLQQCTVLEKTCYFRVVISTSQLEWWIQLPSVRTIGVQQYSQQSRDLPQTLLTVIYTTGLLKVPPIHWPLPVLPMDQGPSCYLLGSDLDEATCSIKVPSISLLRKLYLHLLRTHHTTRNIRLCRTFPAHLRGHNEILFLQNLQPKARHEDARL